MSDGFNEELKKEYQDKVKELEKLTVTHFLSELVDRNTLSQSPPKNNFYESQWFLLLFGFLLTGGLGSLLNYVIQERLSEREDNRLRLLAQEERRTNKFDVYNEKKLIFWDSTFTKIQEYKYSIGNLLGSISDLMKSDSLLEINYELYKSDYGAFKKITNYFRLNKYSIKAKINTYYEPNLAIVLDTIWDGIEYNMLADGPEGIGRYAETILLILNNINTTTNEKLNTNYLKVQYKEIDDRFKIWKAGVDKLHKVSRLLNEDDIDNKQEVGLGKTKTSYFRYILDLTTVIMAVLLVLFFFVKPFRKKIISLVDS